jgi:hypothetical protein
MDVERIIRNVDKRVGTMRDEDRTALINALREALSVEQRWAESVFTVEAERGRRQQAETLKAGLEGIVRHARFDATSEEVLHQLARVVSFDSCSLSILEQSGEFRIVASHGFKAPGHLIGRRYKDALSELVQQTHEVIAIPDAEKDERYVAVQEVGIVRSWAAVPLVVEGEMIGVLSLDRHVVDPFSDEELHRAKALAFSAAAAIRNARTLESVERYAGVMEWLVTVHRDVLDGASAAHVAQAILEGAIRLGYPGGLLLTPETPPRIAAAAGEIFRGATGHKAPVELASDTARHIAPASVPGLGRALDLELPEDSLYLVPLGSGKDQAGTLVLHDPKGEGSSGDSLTQAYAMRAARAYAHARK